MQNGCTKRDSIIVSYKPLPIKNLGKDTAICEGFTYLLDASSPNANYLWQNNSTNPTFLVTRSGVYSVSIDLNGCIKRDTIRIDYNSKPVVSLGPDKTICEGQQLILDPKITNATFLWQDGSSSSTFIVSSPGIYKLTANNQCGNNSDDIVITKGLCQLKMPNAFTPNNDGNNDVFGIKNSGFIKEFYLIIYNRWGEKVFETKDVSKGWDGMYKGIEQPSDNYVWTISYTNLDGKKDFIKGSVVLLR